MIGESGKNACLPSNARDASAAYNERSTHAPDDNPTSSRGQCH
jgi:hypothetical protein